MAYPPDLPPSTRTDSTLSAVNHARDHNLTAAALRDLVEELGAAPAGQYASLTERLLGIAAGQDSEAIRTFLETSAQAAASAQAAGASALTAEEFAELASLIAIGDQDAALSVLLNNVATLTGQRVREVSVAKYAGGTPALIQSDAFVLRSSDDGDQTTALNAFLADPNLRGRRRIIGHARVSDQVIVPDDTWVDAEHAHIEQTANNKTAVRLGNRARWVGGRLLGKTTDYAPSVGSTTPTAVGVRVHGSDATLEDVELYGFAGSAVFTTNGAARGRLNGLRIVGIDGLAGLEIPFGDAGCFGVVLAAGAFDWTAEDVAIEGASIGFIGSYDTTGLTLKGARLKNIPGQHGVYLQNGTDLAVEDVRGIDVVMNLMKVQLAVASPGDSLNARVAGVSGRNIGDTVLLLSNTATAMATAAKFRGVNIAGVNGVNALRVLYLGSIRGGEAVGVSGVETGGAVVTILDSQDLEVANIASRVSAREVVSFTNAAALGGGFSGSATRRVTVRGVRGYNPGNDPALPATANGIAISGTAGDPNDNRDILLDGIDIHADNGLMRYGLALNTTVPQETLRVRNARFRGYTVNPAQLASATKPLAEWVNVDAPANMANFPANMPLRIGSIGNRTRWACAVLPTSGAYQTGDVIENTATAAGGSPGWKVIGGGGLHSGSWASGATYTAGEWKRTSTGRVLECLVGGVAGSTEPAPSNPANIGETITDGAVTWAYRATTPANLKALPNVAA